MKDKTKKPLREFYSAWYGIVSCLLVFVFLVASALPVLNFVTEAAQTPSGTSLTFSPNLLALLFGYSVKVGDVTMDITKFSWQVAIPFILVLASLILFLCSKMSVILGFCGSICLLIAGYLVSGATNSDFYASALQSDYVNMIMNSVVTRQFGYYFSFISLYTASALSFILMIVMRLKASSLRKASLKKGSEYGLAAAYPGTKKKKHKA